MISGSKFLSLFPLCAFLANMVVAAPRIECDAPVYDFGTVTDQNKITHEFAIWNRGGTPLTITKVRACCGMKASMDCMEIAPGSNSICRAVFDLSRRNGEQNKRIYLASNDPKQPYLSLSLTGTHLRSSGIQPKRGIGIFQDSNTEEIQAIPENIVVLFKQEGELHRQVMLTGRNGEAFDVISAEIANADGSVEFSRLRPDRWKCSLSILPASIKPTAVLRVITSSKDQPEIMVPLKIGAN